MAWKLFTGVSVSEISIVFRGMGCTYLYAKERESVLTIIRSLQCVHRKDLQDWQLCQPSQTLGYLGYLGYLENLGSLG